MADGEAAASQAQPVPEPTATTASEVETQAEAATNGGANEASDTPATVTPVGAQAATNVVAPTPVGVDRSTCVKLFLRPLQYSATEEETIGAIRNEFSKYCSVVDVSLLKDRQTGTYRG